MREKQNLKQEVLAKRLAVKTSELHTWESQHRKPRVEMALKLEKALKIILIEQQELKPIGSPSAKAGAGLTIGDMLRR